MFEINDRVIVTDYPYVTTDLRPINGMTGTVVSTEDDYIEVRMDDSPDNIEDYLFVPSEIEVI